MAAATCSAESGILQYLSNTNGDARLVILTHDHSFRYSHRIGVGKGVGGAESSSYSTGLSTVPVCSQGGRLYSVPGPVLPEPWTPIMTNNTAPKYLPTSQHLWIRSLSYVCNNVYSPRFSSLLLQICARLKNAFKTGRTKPVQFRKQQLLALAYLLKDNTALLQRALASDLGRSDTETIV
jgi:hypothetical protein